MHTILLVEDAPEYQSMVTRLLSHHRVLAIALRQRDVEEYQVHRLLS